MTSNSEGCFCNSITFQHKSSHALLRRNVAAVLNLLIHAAGISLFDQRPVIHDCIVNPESSGEVVGFIAAALQNSAGNAASQAALADHINRLTFFDLIQTITQFVNGNVLEAFDVSMGEFAYGSGVKQRYASIAGQLCRILGFAGTVGNDACPFFALQRERRRCVDAGSHFAIQSRNCMVRKSRTA